MAKTTTPLRHGSEGADELPVAMRRHPGATLIHGSIQGFEYPRINHAWVILANCTVFEPITNQVFDPEGLSY